MTPTQRNSIVVDERIHDQVVATTELDDFKRSMEPFALGSQVSLIGELTMLLNDGEVITGMLVAQVSSIDGWRRYVMFWDAKRGRFAAVPVKVRP